MCFLKFFSINNPMTLGEKMQFLCLSVLQGSAETLSWENEPSFDCLISK